VTVGTKHRRLAFGMIDFVAIISCAAFGNAVTSRKANRIMATRA
jgi:hypothetical protein